MKISEETLPFFNESGINYIRRSIISGLKKQLHENGGEDGDFDAVCLMWEDLERKPGILPLVVEELNDCDKDDMFGTKGWEKCFGLEN